MHWRRFEPRWRTFAPETTPPPPPCRLEPRQSGREEPRRILHPPDTAQPPGIREAPGVYQRSVILTSLSTSHAPASPASPASRDEHGDPHLSLAPSGPDANGLERTKLRQRLRTLVHATFRFRPRRSRLDVPLMPRYTPRAVTLAGRRLHSCISYTGLLETVGRIWAAMTKPNT